MIGPVPPAGSRITAILFRRVGDSLLATPALRALKRGLPGSILRVVSEPQTARVFAHNPWVDELEVTDRVTPLPLAARLRRSRPDVVVDFLSDPRTAIATLLSSGQVRVGFSHPLRRRAYTHTVPLQDPARPIYSAAHKLKLAAALGVANEDTHLEFHLSQQDHEFARALWQKREWSGGPVAAFFVHSRRAYKRWPLELFAEVMAGVRDRYGLTPIALSTPGDRDSVSTLVSLVPLADAQVVELRDLGHLGAVMARCALLVGNDGGPVHIAAALGVPTVTIFRDERYEYWTPPHSQIHVPVSAAPGGLIDDVQAATVVAAVESLLPVLPSL